ncbi:MAG: lysylphosphatidylglycerol synthase transmembrane domain-containing protein [Gammaproteobacteria bacterium]
MIRRLALIALSTVILALLWQRIGWREVIGVCLTLDPAWFAAAVLLFIPQTLLAGARWAWIVRCYQPLAIGRATEIVLASSALNVILPSKLGDIAKGLWLNRDEPRGDVASGLALGVFEKGLDTAALALIMLCATLLSLPTERLGWAMASTAALGAALFLCLLVPTVAGWLARRSEREHTGVIGKALALFGRIGELVLRLHRAPGNLLVILVSAVLLWCLHLLQFSWVLNAAHGSVATALLWSRVPMAIFIGLLPVSFAGIGTRDLAMVYLLAPPLDAPTAAALGVFATLRYVLVAIAGLAFLQRLPLHELRKLAPTGRLT